VSTYAAKDE
jgi:chromosome segregation ATPase